MNALSDSEEKNRKYNIIKDIKNLFRLKEIDKSTTKNIRSLFRLKKENETIKDEIITDIELLFEQEDDYYKPERVGNFGNNSYIEYESNDNRNKKLSVKKYHNEIKPYLKDIITNLQKSGT